MKRVIDFFWLIGFLLVFGGLALGNLYFTLTDPGYGIERVE